MGDLGRKVFREVEAPQGHAFISDAIEEIDDKDVVPSLRGALRQARKVAQILERHLNDWEREEAKWNTHGSQPRKSRCP